MLRERAEVQEGRVIRLRSLAVGRIAHLKVHAALALPREIDLESHPRNFERLAGRGRSVPPRCAIEEDVPEVGLRVYRSPCLDQGADSDGSRPLIPI